ncbi:MAG: extracellular solute-binding protein [Clostridia bacterium]|nr:extracellular solute-binding protein [Clostridia bacterium]
MKIARLRTYRRAFAILLAITASLTAFAACHGKSNRTQSAVPETFDESKNYSITFWAKSDTNKTQTEIYEKAVKDFETLYPNVKVTLRIFTDYGRIYNDVITNISTDTTPNVCITYPDHIATYLTGNNVVVPLDDYISNEKYGLGGSSVKFDSPAKSEVMEKFLDECVLDGKYYGVPFMRSTEACYINKTYVEKLGYELPEKLTWDFVWEVSEAAMQKGDDGNYLVNGQNVLIPFMYKSTDNMMIQMLRQKNIGYSDADGNVLIFNDDTMSLLFDLANHCKTKCFSTFKIDSYPGNYFNAGQCIFAVDSTAGATWIGTKANHMDISADQVVDFETVVYPIPQFDVDEPKMISQGPSLCIFNKSDPQVVLASWLFCQFLLTNEVQMAYAETEGYVPVTKKAQESPLYVDYLARSGEDAEHYQVKIDATKLLLDNVDNTFITPVFNGSASLRDAAGQLIENVVKSVRRKETVDEAYMKKLYSDVRSLYRLDQKTAISGNDQGQVGNGDKTLPAGSIALLITLAVAWLGIATYFIITFIKNKKHAK